MKIESNKENLEKALTGLKPGKEKPKEAPKGPQMSKEQEIGFHQGALNTLIAERNELIKMIANIEAIMQAHLKRLEELGVKIQTQKQE
jgi:hypothetical protein